MSRAGPEGPATRPGARLAACLVLVLGLGMLALRPPLPVDETRYLEVFHESLEGSPLLLRLGGEPYAEKPPLLFWCGALLQGLGLPADLALRLVPVLASVGVVLLVERLGRSARLELVGWIQAALFLPLLGSQFLLFDPLLSLGVWGALEAWVRAKDGQVLAWSAVALLAKGPVASLFLIPLLWSLAPLRAPGGRLARRAAASLGLALVPLAAWALAAARLGGPEFANALLWERWAGRMTKSADHPRALYFYLPVIVIGALPGTLALARRMRADAPLWSRRLGAMVIALLVAFTLIRGKQAHYLIPLAPALALCLAQGLALEPRLGRALRAGACIQLALSAGLAVAAAVLAPRFTDSFGSVGCAYLEGSGWRVPLVAAALLAVLLIGRGLRAEVAPRKLLAQTLLGTGACLLALAHLGGELLYPHALARALGSEPGPLAVLGSNQHGLVQLLARRGLPDKLRNGDELAAWVSAHPRGLVLVESDMRPGALPAGLEPVTRDRLHGVEVELLRAVESAPGF